MTDVERFFDAYVDYAAVAVINEDDDYEDDEDYDEDEYEDDEDYDDLED